MASSALPRMVARILLKSCAIPPASVPIASIFWDSRNCPSSAICAARAALRSVMLRTISETPISFPVSSRIGDSVLDISIRWPSRCRRTVSALATLAPSIKASIMAAISGWRSSGTINLIDLPIMPSAAYPNRRSAPGFQLSTMPSGVLLIMASSLALTSDLNCRSVASPRLRSLISRTNALNKSLPSR